MALITCPVCGKDVPDTAVNCDNCRFPLGKFIESEKEIARKTHEQEERKKAFANIVENSENLKESLTEIKKIAYGQIPENLQNELNIVDFKPDKKSRSIGELFFYSGLILIFIVGIFLFYYENVVLFSIASAVMAFFASLVFIFLLAKYLEVHKAIREYDSKADERKAKKDGLIAAYRSEIDGFTDVVSHKCHWCDNTTVIIKEYGDCLKGCCPMCGNMFFVGLKQDDGEILHDTTDERYYCPGGYYHRVTERINYCASGLTGRDENDYKALSVLNYVLVNYKTTTWRDTYNYADIFSLFRMSWGGQELFTEMLMDFISVKKVCPDGTFEYKNLEKVFYYVYEIMTGGHTKNRDLLKSYLQSNRYGDALSLYEYVLTAYHDNINNTPTLLSPCIVSCPKCGSEFVEKTEAKTVLKGLQNGYYSDKKYHCKKCYHRW